MESGVLGLYVHIPFCRRKCRYCDFNSRAPLPGMVEAYLEALETEICLFGRECTRAMDTIYVGGGTPTMLDPDQLRRLFTALKGAIAMAPKAEVTIEANPGSIDQTKTEILLDLGVNRVSVGVQSFHDPLLKLLGRVHGGNEAGACLDMLSAAGLDNVSADLIYGLPGQTLEGWRRDLHRLLDKSPRHISLYALTIEKGTPLHRLLKAAKIFLPEEKTVVQMYRLAGREAKRAGYEQYEISNWSKPGFRSRHNMLYWTGGGYRGLGAGAHSYSPWPQPTRWANVKDPIKYIGRQAKGLSPIRFRETLPPRIHRAEALMLGLRLIEGINIEEFSGVYGKDPRLEFADPLAEGHARGWLMEKNGRLLFTENGRLFSDNLFGRLFD